MGKSRARARRAAIPMEWDPNTNPVHRLIELIDRLRAGWLRWRSVFANAYPRPGGQEITPEVILAVREVVNSAASQIVQLQTKILCEYNPNLHDVSYLQQMITSLTTEAVASLVRGGVRGAKAGKQVEKAAGSIYAMLRTMPTYNLPGEWTDADWNRRLQIDSLINDSSMLREDLIRLIAQTGATLPDPVRFRDFKTGHPAEDLSAAIPPLHREKRETQSEPKVGPSVRDAEGTNIAQNGDLQPQLALTDPRSGHSTERILQATPGIPANETGNRSESVNAKQPHSPAKKNTKKGKNINARMLDILSKNLDAYSWSKNQWAEHLNCGDGGSVIDTKAWEQIRKFRAIQAAERVGKSGASNGGKRKPRH